MGQKIVPFGIKSVKKRKNIKKHKTVVKFRYLRRDISGLHLFIFPLFLSSPG